MRVVVDKRFTMRTERTPRIMDIAESFGVGLEEREFVVLNNVELDLPESGVVYIHGTSGSGKSVLLKELSAKLSEAGKKVMNFDDVELGDQALIDSIGSSTQNATRLLACAGISDAYIYLRKPRELSDGQRARFRLAKLLEQNAEVIVCDEFCAVLDRDCAKTVAFVMQKLIREQGRLLIVATTHQDLINDLNPDMTIYKRYQERIDVKVNTDA